MVWASVEFTHHRGVRIAKGQAHPRGVIEGELQSFTVGPSRADAVSLKTAPHNGEDVAVLYRFRLVGIAKDGFRISGLERHGNPPAWMHQEWICTVKSRPRDLEGEPTRDRRP